MPGKPFCILVTVSLLLSVVGSFAEDAAAPPPSDTAALADQTETLIDMSLEDLMNITVTTTSKSEEKISEAPGVISVMTSDDMKRFGARTLKDVLMRMPSINMSTMYIGDRSCVSMRGDQIGAAQNHILLLINGRPVREAQDGGIKGEMYESFPVTMIDRLEVIRGPGSVLYGSNAFSGVINVITKKAADNKTGVTVQGGLPGQVRALLNTGYQIGDFGFTAGGQYHKAKPWEVDFEASDNRERIMKIPDDGFGAFADLSFKGLRYMTSYDLWNNYYIMQAYIPPPLTGPVAGRHAYGEGEWKKWFNDLGYTHKFSEIYDVTANVTYTQSWLTIDSFPAPHRNSFDLTYELTNFIHPMENMNIIVGFLGNRVQGKEESGLPLSTTLDTAQNAFSGYLQGDYRIIPQIKVIAGVQANKAQGIDLDVNPRFGLIWTPDDIVNVKALYSTAFRAPSMMELYLSHPTLKGTPGLKPEKIRTVDLGTNIQTDKVSIGINSFYSELTNIIYRTTGPNPNKYVNSGGTTTLFGLETEGKIFITKELMLTGSGLLQYNTNGDSVGNMMPVPEASAKGGISYSANGFTVSVFNIYEGKLHSRYNTTYNPTRKAFNLLNANLKYEISRLFKLEVPVITFFVDGYNLLNKEVWLPATGMPKQFTAPAIEGYFVNFGLTVGF